MKKVIVTGATSFIGVHLVERLIAQGYYIIAIIRPDSIHRNRISVNKNMDIIELEMGDYARIPDIVSEAEAFFHLAWDGVRSPKRDDASVQKRNYECSVTAINVASKLKCKRFIGIGSQAEYGEMDGIITETYPCMPVTEYGKAKFKTYTELSKFADSAGIDFVWARIFSLYGQYDDPGTLIMSCIVKMQKNERVKLTACTQKWDYLYVGDAVNALVLLIEKPDVEGIYNIASGEHRVLKDYVEEIKALLHSDSILEYGAIPYVATRVTGFEPNVEKLRKLGWKPLISFSDGINTLCKNGNM